MEEAQSFTQKDGEVKGKTTVLAWRYESPQDPDRILKWMGGGSLVREAQGIRFTTPRGSKLFVKLGDWVINSDSYFFAIEANLFDTTFERVMTGQPAVVETKDPGPAPNYIPIGKDCIADLERTVIVWQGQNYYRGCGVKVKDLSEGVHTTCMKPINHKSRTHEDSDGDICFEYTTIKSGRVVSLSLDKEPNAFGGTIEIVEGQ